METRSGSSVRVTCPGNLAVTANGGEKERKKGKGKRKGKEENGRGCTYFEW